MKVNNRQNRSSVLTRLVCVLVLVSLLTISAPAAPETIHGIAAKTTQELRFRFITSSLVTGLPKWFAAFFTPRNSASTTPTVTQIRIFPGDVTIRQDTDAVLAAVGYDSENNPISGLEFSWTHANNAGRQRSFFGGVFKGRMPGTFTITATADGQQAQVTVTVLPEDREGSAMREQNGTRVSSRRGIESKGDEADQKEPQSQVNSLVPEGGWNNDNWPSADNPGNQPGNPPGGPIDGGAGNGNFQLSAPVISLPGRGIDLALNLNYNSRVWNKSDNQLTYDIDRGFPAPGWSLGFGKLAFMGPQGGCMLVDADGTRHGYAGQVFNWSTRTSFTGHTADGSFIDYNCEVGFGGGGPWGTGWVKLPNGTNILYSSATDNTRHLYPTLITDVQGNFISITYRNNQGPELETITDTLGRVITFEYDQFDRLLSVEIPRMGDQGSEYGDDITRKALKLHYKPLTLNYSFASGITPVVRDSTVNVIDAIYYPGTKTGYWFDDSDSYSSYGMITKVVEQRGMDWQTSAEEQGTVIAGDVTKQAEYNYPLTTTNETGRTNGTGLTDAPTYTTLKESWAGRDVAEDAITTYSINENDFYTDIYGTSPARTVTVTQPTGIVSKQYSYRTPGAWMDGLVFVDETFTVNGSTQTLVGKSRVSWQQGNQPNNLNYDSPQPAWARIWDENGDEIRTEYTYGTNKFNQITRSCDFDDANVKLRCATAEYENSADYIGQFESSGKFISGRHIFNLVKSSRVEDAAATVVSRVDYEYDNYQGNQLTDTPGVVQHNPIYNPHTTVTKLVPGMCLLWDTVPCEPGGPPRCRGDCLEYEWNEVSVYEPWTDKRGNVTKVTHYTNAADASGPIQETRGFDITGNLIRASSTCCEETSFEYTVDTKYGYPESSTHGAADLQSPHRVTTTAVYSYETGLVKQATDANGLTSTSWYNPDTLRPVKSVSSTGAYSTIAYDDEAMTIEEEVREFAAVGEGALAGRSKKYLNGIGLVVKEESFAPSSIVDIVETKYTKFAEAWKQSRPYRAGDNVYWSEKFYDNQRRLVKVVEPDGSTTEAFYNETALPDSVSAAPGNTIRIADAWGRERWGRYDQQGRLVHVVEPNPDKTANPNGKVVSVAGSLLTKYKYDTLGRLIETEQGVQFRKFKYDSLGRLTRQKLAEQTATLNDAGAFVGAGGTGAAWSEAFNYDNRSNLTMKTDARGVRTHFSFQLPGGGGQDPLNRIQMRSYDTSGPLQPGLPIHNVWGPNVFYEYMTTGDKSRIKKIVTQGLLTEDYTYDGESRVNEYKQTVDYRTSYPMTTSYVYDSLDRVKEVHYPAQYGFSGSPRKIVAHTYDTASRLTQMTYGGAVQASDMIFNAADQTTEIKIGAAGKNQVTEEYTFDPQTGLLTNQTAKKNGTTTLLNLSYEYNRLGSAGNLNGKTGHLTKIIDNLNNAKNREYEFDAVGRLTKAKGGATGTLWDQNYTYDRYGNRTNVVANGVAADSSPIPLDGLPNLAYDATSNRITTAGFEYDVAGNQIKAPGADGNGLIFEYDAANRISVIKKESDGSSVQGFQYGSTNARLMDHDSVNNQLKIFASTGGTVLAEYTEFNHTVPTWTKTYTYLGSTQLATVTPNGSGGEYVEFNHPDRLGTKVITNQPGGTSYEQNTLPFGTALNAESTGSTNKRFTSYDRSNATGLDYAINRTYDSKQGRFTQVDPIGMSATHAFNPQTLNLYAYAGNDPINHLDPEGLFFGFFKKLFKWIGKALKWIAVVVAIVVAVIAVVTMPASAPLWFKIFTIMGAVGNAASSVFSAFGLQTASKIFGIIAAIGSFGAAFYTKIGEQVVQIKNWTKKLIAKVIKAGATLASRVLSALGHVTSSRVMGIIATVADFVDGGFGRKDKYGKDIAGWEPSTWAWFKVIRGVSEQTAVIVGAKKVAAYLGLLGLLEDFYGIKESIKGTKDGLGSPLHSLANDSKFKSFFNNLNNFFGISSGHTGIRIIFTRTLGTGRHLNSAFGRIRSAAPNL